MYMKEIKNGLFSLINYLNNARGKENEYKIAEAIIKNFGSIEGVSLEKLANLCYTSQSSVSRFVKKIGYQNFQELKVELGRSKGMLSGMTLNEVQLDFDNIIKNRYANIINNINTTIETMDLIKLIEIVNLLCKYKRISFFGSHLSLAMFYKLQLRLIKGEKLALAYNDETQQLIHSRELTNEDLVIVINIAGRWYDDSYEIIKNINKSGAKTILLTQTSLDFKMYDIVYKFGIEEGYDYGYFSLLNLCSDIYDILVLELKKKNEI